MKYLCLGYHEQGRWEVMSEAERKALLEECAVYDEVLRRGGHCIELVRFDAETTTTLRFEGGRVAVSDPSLDGTAHLGGMMLLEARDLNDAIRLMSQLPCMRAGGRLEIRRIKEGD
jgi:hypothetical protein